jgi:hypothetical protein
MEAIPGKGGEPGAVAPVLTAEGLVPRISTVRGVARRRKV